MVKQCNLPKTETIYSKQPHKINLFMLRVLWQHRYFVMYGILKIIERKKNIEVGVAKCVATKI